MCMSFLKWAFVILILPTVAMADSSIGEIADNLLGPTSFLTKFVEIACYIVGFIFIFMAFAQYKIHRQSPKLVPLMTPVTLAFLALIAFLIPYSTTLTKTGKAEVKKTESTQLPMPDVTNRNSQIPLPPSSVDVPPQTPPPSDPSGGSERRGGSGGSWTNDPRYNR